MAFKLAEAYVQLSQKGFAQVEGHVGKIHAGLGKMKFAMGAVTGAVSAFAASGAVRVFGDFVEAAAESERQTAKLAAVLKTTGGVSGQTVEGLESVAAELQRVTAFEDDTIKGAQAVLLTFKSIRGDEFRQATEAAMDLATVFEMDLRSAATMVGKALEDPIRGITALRRAGVSFTKEQQDMIKSLVETGEAAKAQGAILKEIQGQVGGSARAVGDTTFGQIEQLRNEMGDLAELIGSKLSPAVEFAIETLRAWSFMLGGESAMLADFGKRSSGMGDKFLNAKSSSEAEQIQKDYFALRKEYKQLGMEGSPATVFGTYAANSHIAQLRTQEETERKQFAAARRVGGRAMDIAGTVGGSFVGPAKAFAESLSGKIERESEWLRKQFDTSLRQERLLQSILDRLTKPEETARFEP